MKAARISATSASNSSFQPNSSPIDDGMAIHEPAHVAGAMLSKVMRGGSVRFGVRCRSSSVLIRPIAETRPRRFFFDSGAISSSVASCQALSIAAKVFAPFARQRDVALAGVLGRRRALQKTLLLEAREDAAQIAAIEREIAAELGRGRVASMRQLVEHARLRSARTGRSAAYRRARRSAACRSG